MPEVWELLSKRSGTLKSNPCWRQHFHALDNYRPRIPRATFLCGCCCSALQYGGRGKDLALHDAVNGKRRSTFTTVGSEIPAFATTCAASYSKTTNPGNMDRCVRKVLSEFFPQTYKDAVNQVYQGQTTRSKTFKMLSFRISLMVS